MGRFNQRASNLAESEIWGRRAVHGLQPKSLSDQRASDSWTVSFSKACHALTHDNYRVNQLTEFHSPIFAIVKWQESSILSDFRHNSQQWLDSHLPKGVANAYFDKDKIKLLELPWVHKPSLSVYWHSNRNQWHRQPMAKRISQQKFNLEFREI